MEAVMQVWPIIMFLVPMAGALIFDHFKVAVLQKDFEDYRTAQEKKEQNVWTKIDNIQATTIEIAKTLARLEGKLQNKI